MVSEGQEDRPLTGGDRPETGRWDEARGSRDDLPLAPPPWWARRGCLVFSAILLALMVLLIVGLVVVLNVLPDKRSMYEDAAVQSLRSLHAAQVQYHQQYHCYADAAWRLNIDRHRIGDNLKNEFGDWQNNGDQPVPLPKDGYDYRLLQGEDPQAPRGWHINPNDPTAGMLHWAATARCAEPGTFGDHQFYINENGEIYQFPEPMQGASSLYKQFLLEVAPTTPPAGWERVR